MRVSKFLRPVGRWLGVLGAVGAVMAIDYRVFHVNSATAAFSFLLLILGLATKLGLTESIIASLGSALAYNFFFLPPVHTLAIADPQNWVALFVFLVTALTASQLSSSARGKAEEAAAREQEVQRLYEFSRALMLRDPTRHLADEMTQKISEIFSVEDVGVYDRKSGSIFRTMPSTSRLEDAALRETATTGVPWQNTAIPALIVPIRLGGPSLGSLGIAGNLSEIALRAIAQLVAIALERARSQEIAARAEAANQNEQLKSTVLDALAHEFKTPLTSIKAAAGAMLGRENLDEAARDLLSVVDEEADRMSSLVSEAIELGRIGSGPVKLHRENCSVETLIYSAVRQLKRLTEGRVLDIRIERNLPHVSADRKLTELALRQIMNNALKYSPPASEIQIAAESQSDAIVIRTSNPGPGIPQSEQALIFEKFYRGHAARTRIPGTGMGLAIARDIIEAHGGRIWLNSEPGKPVQFSFTLPIVMQKQRVTEDRVQNIA